MRFLCSFLFAVLLVLLSTRSTSGSTNVHSCIGRNGQPVDYWIMLKTNLDSSSTHPQHKLGVGYGYIDSTMNKLGAFTIPTDHGFLSDPSPLKQTLDQVYEAKAQNDQSKGYLMYNDDIPMSEVSADTWGHTKGVLSFSNQGGFWLIHSYPNFPNDPEKSSDYTKTESVQYGQSFMCLSLDRANIDVVANHLQVTEPIMYAARHSPQSLDTAVDKNLALLLALIDDPTGKLSKIPPGRVNPMPLQFLRKTPSGGARQLVTRMNKIAFQAIGKNGDFEFRDSPAGTKTAQRADLFADLVAPTLKVPLFVETWMRPFEKSIDIGKATEARNVKSVQLSPTIQWGETKDHSKWCLSQKATQPWACVGDMNKNKSQYDRGGAMICIRDAGIWKAFRAVTVPWGSDEPEDSASVKANLVKKPSSRRSAAAAARPAPESDSDAFELDESSFLAQPEHRGHSVHVQVAVSA